MHRSTRTALVGIMLAGTMAIGPAALASNGSPASGGGGGVTASGHCSGIGTWTLKAKPDNGMVEVEFEVDTNRAGQTFEVTLADNTVVFFSGRRTTQPPSGSFQVRAFTANRAGSDRIVARAKNIATGNTCAGTVTL